MGNNSAAVFGELTQLLSITATRAHEIMIDGNVNLIPTQTQTISSST
jgi:hypothetical protein